MDLSPIQIAAIALGLGIAGAGARLVWLTRRTPEEADTARILGLTRVSAVVLGIGLVIGGYHAIAYALPEGMVVLAVPRRLWWVVLAGIVLTVAGSVAADHLDGSRG